MFASPAYAANGAAASGGGAMGILGLLPWVAIFVIFYFLMIRPQQRRVKQHQAMIAAVKKNDVAITGGGVIGKVTKVIDDDQIEVELAEGIRVRQIRAMVSDVRAKGEPAKAETK